MRQSSQARITTRSTKANGYTSAVRKYPVVYGPRYAARLATEFAREVVEGRALL